MEEVIFESGFGVRLKWIRREGVESTRAKHGSTERCCGFEEDKSCSAGQQ